MIGIYKITSPSGAIYIGQSIDIDRRKGEHKKMACYDQPRLFNSLMKYGFDAHQFEIVEELDCSLDRSQIAILLNKLEVYYVQKFNCMSPNGMNLRGGGDQSVMSDETKKKIGDFHVGTHLSEETKANIRTWRDGKTYDEIFGEEKAKSIKENQSKSGKKRKHSPMAEKTKQKIREKRTGFKSLEETCIKISKALMGGSRVSLRKAVDCFSLDGVFIHTYVSITEAERVIESNLGDIGNCCAGRQKTCHGFIWKYCVI
jgi:group I intron endonuclease